jgi:UDP-N-acetylmuramoylalanine--D-glutamate ligase
MMGTRIGILGGGESGCWAAVLAASRGMLPVLFDESPLRPAYKTLLESHGISFLENVKEFPSVDFDYVVVSPGIADAHPWIQTIAQAGIRIESELEFASRFNNRPILAITGSNGKTTTAKLAYHLLKTAGMDVALGGNYGECFSHLIMDQADKEVYVLEVSSFQLDHIHTFAPTVSVVLNITPDHLDRYGYDFENYAAAKMKMMSNQTSGNLTILNQELFIRNGVIPSETQCIWIPMPMAGQREVTLSQGETFHLPADRLLGRHNGFNAHCALEAVRYFTSDVQALQKGLDTFEGDPHRLEYLGEINGILFVNDSKATNVDSVYYALEAMQRPVVWVVGGVDKGNVYTMLDSLVREKVKAIVCLGKDNKKILEHFSDFGIPMVECDSAAGAVDKALSCSLSGDVVLLSPACASFDLFRNYMDRGDQFREAVNLLRKN